jgi:chorismate mutase
MHKEAFNAQSLAELRQKIDVLDDQMRDIFLQRMGLVAQVAELKREADIPVLHRDRESEIIRRLSDGLDEENREDLAALFEKLFELSRSRQA